jgi:aminoglycoside phosphotransferase (APT) family kinase protein
MGSDIVMPAAKLSRDDLEPRIHEILEAKKSRRLTGPYSARTESQVTASLGRLYEGKAKVSSVRRLSGGASKEQFVFTLDDNPNRKLVLRLDPLEGILETCRYRESEVMRALHGTVPVPRIIHVDGEGDLLGQSGIIVEFVSGVAKPPEAQAAVSGLQTHFSDAWVARLAPQFMNYMVLIHGFDFRKASLPHFDVPDAHSLQPALWQVNWWSKIWRDDALDACPMIALTEEWLRRNLPPCDDPVLLHGDYRTGNYLFDAETGAMTSVLDWELAHVGDFHEDIAWNLQPVFAQRGDDGQLRYSGLFRRDEFIHAYEAASGRKVVPSTLLFYDVLNAWKAAIIDLSTCLITARDGNNHQDILLSWLACSGHTHLEHISTILLARS